MYGLTEANLGITCACIVTLRPLLHKLWVSLPGMRGTRAAFDTDTKRSMPRISRIRASLYHITVSSGNNTEVGPGVSQNRDGDIGGSSVEKGETTVTVVVEECKVQHGGQYVRVKA